jgi:glutamate carboxypeptidase
MKGGLVILLKALETLENSPHAGKIGWTVLINSDEEIGSPGSTPLFMQHAVNHKFGLIFEPSFPDGTVVSARKGSAAYTAIARGKAAHVGRDFHLGKNAITAIARFALAVDSLTNDEKGTTVNIGIFEGGGPINIVPDLGICRLNVRATSDQEMQAVHEKLEQIAKEMNIELFLDNSKAVKEFDKTTEALFERVAEHAKRYGFDLKWKPTGGVCDGNTLAAAGIPSIDTLGVVGAHMHTPGEYALIDSLTERAKWTASLLFEEAGWIR